MGKKQITKKQHYVPVFYLKKFVNSKGKLEILDCERLKIVSPRVPKSICRQKFFYSIDGKYDEISQIIESECQKIEDNIAKNYDPICEKIRGDSHIDDSDKLLLSTFMSLQYLRGLSMRKQIKRMDSEMVKHLTKLRFSSKYAHKDFDRLEKETGEIISNDERLKTIKIATEGEYDVETNNISHLKFLAETEEFRNLFFGKYWTVYILKSDSKFFTSDNPVIEEFPKEHEKFFSNTFFDRTHYFSVAPDILIVATQPYSVTGKKIKRKTLFDRDKEKIDDLNFIQFKYADRYVYSGKYNGLQYLLNKSLSYKKNQDMHIRNLYRSFREEQGW